MELGEIRTRTETCRSLFTECLSIRPFSGNGWFELRQGEFNLWVTSLKAADIGRSSLDYRVRDSLDVRELVCDLLDGLSEALKDLIQTAELQSATSTSQSETDSLSEEDDIGSAFSGFSTNGGDTAPLPDIDDTNGVFSEHMFSVKAILGQLARISTAIRRSGAKYRYQKADSSLKVEDFKDFKGHLTLVVLKGNLVANAAEQGDAIAILSRLTDSQLLTKVQRRLIDANIVRRNRIIFATRRMRAVVEKPGVEHLQNHKLPIMVTKMPSETTEPEPEHELAPQLFKELPDSAFNRPTAQLQNPSIKASSVTQTATEIGSQLNTQRAMELKNPTSSIITRITKIGGAQDYPGCPEPTSDFLQCPYCADLLPAAYSENQSRWRGHVAQDIFPYMCIYENCETSDQMYLTSDDLLNHMRSQHGITHWVCSHCGSRSETGHSYVFKCLEDWESHMKTEHMGVHPSRLQSLSKVSQRILLEPLGCPLCGYVTEHPQSTLDDHIAKHLHEFALRCLPWDTGRGGMESANMKNFNDSTSSELLTEGDEDDQGGDVAYFDPTEADSPEKLFERLEDIHAHFSKNFEPRAIHTELYEEELRGTLLSVIEQFSEYISAAGPFVTPQAYQLVQQESRPLALIDFFDPEDIKSQQQRVRMSGKLRNYTSNLSPSFPGRDNRLLEIYGSHMMKITQILYQALLGWGAQQPSASFDPHCQTTKIILEMKDEHDSGAVKAELAKECNLKSDQQGDIFKKKSDVEKKSMDEYKTQITRHTKMMIEDELDVLSAALSRVPFEDQNHVIRRSLTFRISNIPLEVTRDMLENILTRLSKTTDDGQSDLLRFSYSPAAVSILAKRFAVATATFAEAPSLGELQEILKKAIGDRGNELIVDLDFFGLTPLADPLQNTLVDIIAVTGLAGHAFGSWKSKSKPDMWLRDFLPISIPNARVLTYGYDTKLPGSRTKSSIFELSRKLLESIKTTRDESTKHRPLILIGHSLGGLVVKQALVQASEGSEDDLAVFRSCYAIMLFAVPNRGLDNLSLMSMVKGQPNEDLVKKLSGESLFLNYLHECFNRRSALDLEIICAYETRTTPTVEWNLETQSWERTGPEVMIVPQNSAIYAGPNKKPYDQLPIEADHSEIVKFSDASNSDYIIVQSRIEKWVQRAPAVIQERFARLRTSFSFMEAQYIEALKAPDYAAFRNYNIDNPTSGTLGWFLELQQLSSWLTIQESSVLWVNGSPGQGKTIVAKFLLTHLEDLQHSFNHRTTVIYFFFYGQDDSYRTAGSAVRSLIKQLLSTQGAFDVISDKFDIEASAINDELAWDILEELLRSPVFGTIYCVIDALDECHDGESRQRLLACIKRALQMPPAKTREKYPVLKVFLTSRPTTDLSRTLRKFPFFDLKASPDDLKTFIQSRIQELDLEKQHEDEVIDLLSSRVEQTFLWISIVLKKLKTTSTLLSQADMEQIITESPSRLTDLYESLLVQFIQSRDIAAQKLLIWAVFSRRAMTLDELEVALAIQEESKNQESIEKHRIYLTKKSVTSAVGVFLEIFNEKVYLIHQSAKDFLLKSERLAEAEFCRGLHPNLYLAEICMKYLCFTDFAETGPCGDATLLEKRYRQYPLFHYAAGNWHRHISIDDDIDIFAGVIHQLTEIGSLGLLAWSEAAGITALDKAEDTYDIATIANIPWLTDFQWKGYIITEGVIQKAARSGIAGYEFLKDFTRKADVRITTEAFCAAVKCFDHEMVRLLLHTGANITQAIIEAAATNKIYGKLVIDLLLESRCNFEITAKLVKLATDNHESGIDIMETILRKVNTDISEDAMVAIVTGFGIETMNIVLNTREDVKITSAVLSAAIKKKHGGKEIFHLLLEQSSQDTPIMEEVIELIAESNFRDTMVVLLNQRGDKIVVTDRMFKIMTKHFDDEIMELLFDRQGDQIIITEEILKIAASRDNRRVMQILLDSKGDQVNVTENILERAAKNLNTDVMALLLDRRGDEIIITEKIVEIAADNPNKDLMALLLDRRGDEINITEKVVEIAADNLNEDVMALLLDRRGDQINITEEVVKIAAESSFHEVMALLLDKRGHEIIITEDITKAAVGNDFVAMELTQLLCDKRRDQIVITEEIMKAAVSNIIHADEVVQLLLDQQEDPIVITEDILESAVGNYRCGKTVIELLLDNTSGRVIITEDIRKAAERYLEGV